MSGRLKQAAAVLAIAFTAAQFVRHERAPPRRMSAAPFRRTRGRRPNWSPSRIARAATVWPWYTQVASRSGLMTYGATEGRKAVNLPQWAA